MPVKRLDGPLAPDRRLTRERTGDVAAIDYLRLS